MKINTKRKKMLLIILLLLSLNIYKGIETNSIINKKIDTKENLDSWLEPKLQNKVLDVLKVNKLVKENATKKDITKNKMLRVKDSYSFFWLEEEGTLESFKGIEYLKNMKNIEFINVLVEQNSDFSSLYTMKNINAFKINSKAKIWDYSIITPIMKKNSKIVMDVAQFEATDSPITYSINRNNYKKFSVDADKLLIPYFKKQLKGAQFNGSLTLDSKTVFSNKIRYDIKYNSKSKQYDFTINQKLIDKSYFDEPNFEKLFEEVIKKEKKGERVAILLQSYGFNSHDGFPYSSIQEGKYVLNISTTDLYSNIAVEYLDEEGNNISTREIHNGIINEKYETRKKDIVGYDLVKVKGNVAGTFTKDNLKIKYLYKKNDC